MKHLKYAIYIRKGNEDEKSNKEALKTRMKEVLRLQKEFDLQTIETSYIDIASGYDKNRPFFNQMIETIERGKANGIICLRLSQLARNSKDMARLLYLMSTGALRSIVTSERNYTKSGYDLLSLSFGFLPRVTMK